MNGSRHAGGARNVSLEARRKRAGERERAGRESGRDYECTYTRAHTCRVLLCVNEDTRARAHSMSPKSAATPPLHHHHRYTTMTKVRGVFVHESSVYLVLSVVSVRILRYDAPSLRPSIFATAWISVIFLVKIRERIDARSRKIDEHKIVNSVSRKWLSVAEATLRIFSRR